MKAIGARCYWCCCNELKMARGALAALDAAWASATSYLIDCPMTCLLLMHASTLDKAAEAPMINWTAASLPSRSAIRSYFVWLSTRLNLIKVSNYRHVDIQQELKSR